MDMGYLVHPVYKWNKTMIFLQGITSSIILFILKRPHLDRTNKYR